MNRYSLLVALLLLGSCPSIPRSDEVRSANRLGYTKADGVYHQNYPVDSPVIENGASAWAATWTAHGGLTFTPIGSASANAEYVADLTDIEIRSGWPRFETRREIESALGKKIVVQQTVAGTVKIHNSAASDAKTEFERVATDFGYKGGGHLEGERLVIAERLAILEDLGESGPHVLHPGSSVQVPGVGAVTFDKWEDHVAEGEQSDVTTIHIPEAVGRVRVSYTGDQVLKDHSAQPRFGVSAAHGGYILVEHLGRYDILDVSAQNPDGSLSLTQHTFEFQALLN